jgi:hypothetical protein
MPSLKEPELAVGFQLVVLPFADDLRHVDGEIAPVGKMGESP